VHKIRYLTTGEINFAGIFLLLNLAWAYNGDDNMNSEDNTAFGLIGTVASGNTAFAVDLYTQLTKDDKGGNLFFSPYSLSTALAMTYAGARGETATQMSQVLHFPKNQAELHPAFSHLQNQVNNATHEDVELNVANALWAQQDYPLMEKFKKSLKKYYQAEPQDVDFETATEAARKKINTWVEKQTVDKIKNLVEKGVLNRLTRLVLVNAIYFKGNWAMQFDPNDTKSMEFWTTVANSVAVPMMTQKDGFGYMENDDLQLLKLSYAGNRSKSSRDNNDIEMIVLLPRERDGLAKLTKLLNPQNLDKWLRRAYWQKVRVFLPKFQISTGFELSKTLSKMGMPNAFRYEANFEGMDGKKELYLSSVIHQAFVDVNEKGTEAAAATAVIVGTRGMSPPPPTFRADHPFIFLIRHNLSGSILFMGRIVNPKK